MAEPLPSLERPPWLDAALGDATGLGVRVAVIDSGCDAAWHDPRILPGVSLVEASAGTADRIGHGTACCDIILGMAPGVEIVPLRIFGERLETSPGTLVAALELALESGTQIVNLSLGTQREDAVKPLYRVCEAARDAGVIVVSAVHFGSGWSYPAVFENVLGVAAERFASVFDYEYLDGEAAECRAQGDREVRGLDDERRRGYGTSYAAPHVTALAALFRERFPGAGLDRVRRLLAEHALGCARRTPPSFG